MSSPQYENTMDEKARVRAEIGQQVEEYLSEGGKINVLDQKSDIKRCRQAFWTASSEYFSLPSAEIS